MSQGVGVPLIAVGAAFDYLAGTLREPPRLIGRWGLEWAWRLLLEPRRLWRRYVLLNPAYLGLLTLQAVGIYRPACVTGTADRVDQLDA
jgi:N-acetylglucosaminyldiphosphoundecaprenol N-acetyl-beta-D-mannosaminyltransferase